MRTNSRNLAKSVFALALAAAVLSAGALHLLARGSDGGHAAFAVPLVLSLAGIVTAGTLLFALSRGPGRAGAVGLVCAVATLALALAALPTDPNGARQMLTIASGSALMAMAAVAAHFGASTAGRMWVRIRGHGARTATPLGS